MKNLDLGGIGRKYGLEEKVIRKVLNSEMKAIKGLITEHDDVSINVPSLGKFYMKNEDK